ncbi:hypothetical protein EAF04_004920 [Stromatinia cepivora]|nr:hypothetical protein EAF04_004920 [Stromatinia cepivora]
MKFAKELEQSLVPEWRAKYLDYKQGKKKVKAVARAAHRINSTPRTDARSNLNPHNGSLYGATSPFVPRNPQSSRALNESTDLPESPPTRQNGATRETAENAPPSNRTASIPIAKKLVPTDHTNNGTYGSFVPTPPSMDMHAFELPDPAIRPDSPLENLGHSMSTVARRRRSLEIEVPERSPERTPAALPQNAYEVGTTSSPIRPTFASLRRPGSRPSSQDGRPNLKRIFSVGTSLSKPHSRPDVDMVAFDHIRIRQQEFFSWMEKELEKVEIFYRSKEDEAGIRLQVLREQLHEMRNRRIQEVADAEQAKATRKDDERSASRRISRVPSGDEDPNEHSSKDHRNAWLVPLGRLVGNAKATALGPHPGSNSRALASMKNSPELQFKSQPDDFITTNGNRDYVRRPHENDVSYRTAKRKLKLALQEYYRGMELLKSYALLNRTAFRKINKKYDKAVNAHPPLRFMTENVNKAWFVNSDVLDGHIHAVEDLYARYFEKGNHKVAVGKLRKTAGRTKDQSGSAFRNGVFIGIGAVFSIQGIISGTEYLNHPDPMIKFQTGYLLQIYGGYFLALYLFSFFCFDCSVWTRSKINYKFVFELDPRHDLDWRQLSEFPAFFILLLGLFLWVNFSGYGTPEMFIYYPVILIFVTVLIIFMPAPVLFHKSRKWFVYSHWRLLLAGLYPVEFRDFFLGDMYCSLTYLTSNIELFFCLYATSWHNPTKCNSTNSRLLGFFSTLPAIWRLLQCLRRYRDTKNMFPHLVNGGKYAMTIVYYVTLSIYRIERNKTNLIVFSFFAALNAVYVSIWDLLMDWSLLQPGANKPFLRDVRGFKATWWYYAAMIIDPLLRFNWIFYSIYTHNLQHSSSVSFFVGLSEISRRGMWTLFRVENEHCSNVARFKAFRDVALPYDLESGDAEESEATTPAEPNERSSVLERERTHTSGLSQQQTNTGSVRRRPQRTFTKVLADAHTQDFQKKRRPSTNTGKDLKAGDDTDVDLGRVTSSEDDDDDDDDDEQDAQDRLAVDQLVRTRQFKGERKKTRGGL